MAASTRGEPNSRVRTKRAAADRSRQPERAPGSAVVSPWKAAWSALGVVAAVTATLHFLLGAPWIGAWLWTIQPATFLVHALDKHQAARHARRVPELALHALALGGGSLAAIAAMSFLRHKTRKTSFRLVLGVILALQVVGLAAWFGTRG